VFQHIPANDQIKIIFTQITRLNIADPLLMQPRVLAELIFRYVHANDACVRRKLNQGARPAACLENLQALLSLHQRIQDAVQFLDLVLHGRFPFTHPF